MRKAIKILIGSSLFYNLSAGLLGPLWALYVQNIGGGVEGATTAWAVWAFFVGILTLLFGRVEDKLNKRIMFVLGRFLDFIGVTGYIFVQSIFQLYLIQGILGASLAIMNPSFNAIYSKSLDKGRESTEWSYWQGSIYIIISMAALAGGAIVTFFGFTTLFVAMSISSFISLMVALMFMRKKIKNEILLIEGKSIRRGKKLKK